MGIKQRQAYNYIQVVESLPARLIEENAAAGVTKLALLAKLNPEEREDLTGEALANITVAELKKLVEERDAMAQQLSIFQTEPKAVAEVEAEPIDPDEIRRQAEEETRQQMAAAFAEERTQLEAKHKAAMSEAVLKAEQAAAAEVRKVKADAKKQAEAETRQQVAQAREEAAKAAAAQQEAKYRAKLDQAKQAEEEAQRRAETMAKQMEASSDENAVRFFMLFEQLQQKVEDMKAITETMRETSIENAEKFLNALRGALSAIMGIYNVLRRCGATVVAYIDGVAASAASVIAMAADKVIMPRNTAMMVHNAAWGVYGNSKELRKSADDLDIINGAMLQSYIVKAGDKLPAEKLEELTDGETWLSAEMCIQYGLADEYAEQDADLTAAAKQYQGARAAFQSRDISTLPAAMAAAISAVAGPQEPPKPQTPKASEAGCLNNILAAMIK